MGYTNQNDDQIRAGAMAQYQIGQVLLNRFQIEAFIASGGMSTVYRVLDLERGASLAMKVLNPDLADDPTFIIRFQNEARSLQQLAHPNIVPFYGLYQSRETTFLLERFIDGPSLSEVLRQRHGTPLPEEDILIYFKALNAGLSYAHTKGVIHCDVKPGNVLIDQGGHIYLTDFGIARFTESPTATMAAMGTPSYMAPEQIRGEPLTRQTDVYAAGVLLYEMLTGRRPFRPDQAIARDAGTIDQADSIRNAHLYQPPPDPRLANPFLPGAVTAVVLRALAKDPANRFPAVSDFTQALFDAEGVDPSKIPNRIRLWDEMHPATLGAGTGAVPPGVNPPELERGQTTRPRRKLSRLPGAALIGLLILALVTAGALAMRQVAGQAGNPSGPSSPAIPTNVNIGEPTPEEAAGPQPGPATQTPPVEAPGLQPPTLTPAAVQPSEFETQGQIAVVLRQNGKDFLYLLDLETSQFTALTGGDRENKNWAPQWSPDGSRLAWFIDSGNKDRLLILSPDGGETTEVQAAAKEFKSIHSPAWLPDSERISFYGVDGRDYWLAIADASNGELIESIPLPRYRNLFVWNWSNNQLAFIQQSNDQYDVVISGAADEPGLVIDTGNEDYAPAWSNDGAWLAFQSDAGRSPGENEIWIARSDGSGLRQVTRSEAGVWSRAPTWSPYGNQIAFVSNRAGSQRADYGELFVVDVASGAVTQVTETGGQVYDWRPAWRP